MTTPTEDDVASQFQLVLHHLGIRGDLGESMASELAAHVINGVQLAGSRALSVEQMADARDIFEGKDENRSACHHCAGLHFQVANLPADRQPCPRVKRLQRHVDGTLTEVEYWPPGEWETDVVFPSDVYDEPLTDAEV